MRKAFKSAISALVGLVCVVWILTPVTTWKGGLWVFVGAPVAAFILLGIGVLLGDGGGKPTNK